MGITNYCELFDRINLPGENDKFQFSGIPIPQFENHRLAKDKFNNPTLLISVDNGNLKLSPNLELAHIVVLFNVNCKVEQDGILIEKTFTAISFKGSELVLRNYFLKLSTSLVAELGALPSQIEICESITRFVELFSMTTEVQLKTFQGLWAELFLIDISKNPKQLISSWHCYPEEKFDFNNGEERLEVKSSSNNLRIHNFSIQQINIPPDTKGIVASVFVKQANNGESIDSLVTKIISKIENENNLIIKLINQVAKTLGQAIHESHRLKFDWYYAKESLLYFRVEDIPTINNIHIPSAISDVRFKSDLSDVTPINLSSAQEYGSLYNSL